MAAILLKEKTGYGQSREGEELWECKVFKGEFLVEIPHEERRKIKGVTPNYRLYRDPEVVLYADPFNVGPLEEREIKYILAVRRPTSVRVKEYLNEVDKKMKMDLVVGDKVLFKLEIAPRAPTASVDGTIRYIGPHPDSDGIVFGIEIDPQDQAYHGKGTTNGSPYFTCGPNNAVFVAMDKIIKKQDDPSHTRFGQGLPEPSVMERPRPTTRSQTKPVTASVQPKSVYDRIKGFVKEVIYSIEDNTAEEEGRRYEAGDVSGHVSRFKEGDRVIIQTVKEDVVAGTVRWVGPIRVAKDMKVDPLAVVGIETDKKIDLFKDFDGVDINVTGPHGTKLFKVAHNHSQVFLPEQMVLTVDEYTLQKQKDHATRFNDATEDEEKFAHSQFTIGSMVCIDMQKGDPLYGVVQWIGTVPDYPGTIAGVELERTTLRDCTDGTWRGRRFFTCPPGRAYFCPVNTLKQDTRYMDMTQSEAPPDFQSILTADGNEIHISSVMEEDYPKDDDLYSIGSNITEMTDEFPIPDSEYEEEDERMETAQDTRANMDHQIVLNLHVDESDDNFETDFSKESLHKLQQEKPQSLQETISLKPLSSFEGIIAVHQQMHADLAWYSTRFDHITQRCEELFDNLEERRSSFRQRASQLQEVYKQNIDKMKEINENLTSRLRSLQNSHNSLTKEHQQLQTSHDTLTANHQKLLKSHNTITANHQELRKSHGNLSRNHQELQKSHNSLKKEHQELQELNKTLTISHEELQMSHENLRITHQEEVTQHQKSKEENENRLQQVNQRLVQAQNEVTKLQSTLQKLESNWKVSHREVSLSKKELGRGGWGVIWLGKFRGQRVAVKQMHELIKSDEYMELLHREINTMSQLRHPNLLQFIGAVLDHPSGNPMIITEVMDTSLRSAYERKEVTTDPGCRPVVLSIMRDVAVGLNYLHCLPDPIIHRDVSSANVLLESKGDNKWKTKISDFGSAKFARAAVTEAPGALVYSAPESIATIHRKKRKQTQKMDSYSYGVLLCEVLTCRFPDVEKFESLSLQVKVSSPQLYKLIVSCINEEPDKRPTMSEIIIQLDRFIANK